MIHPGCDRFADRLAAFADGDDDPGLAAHVAACAACAAEVAALGAVLQRLRAARPVLDGGAERTEADWEAFSLAVARSYDRARLAHEGTRLGLPGRARRYRGLGAGLLAVAAAAVLLVALLPARRGAPITASPGGLAERIDAPAPLVPAPLVIIPEPAGPGAPTDDPVGPGGAAGAGLLADEPGLDIDLDLDTDELLDALDGQQLEAVARALQPGA